MSKHLPREDTQPWYKQFWPWFLIALPGFVVVAGINMVFIAHEGADDLVVDEYYKEGLAINRRLEKKQRATDLGIVANLAITGDEVIVRTDGPVTAERLTLLLSHPLESNQDFQIVLVKSVPGEYRGRLSASVAERWHWALFDEGAQTWRLDGSITSDAFSAAGGG